LSEGFSRHLDGDLMSQMGQMSAPDSRQSNAK
jgi:hypothetical protein